jgi:hypothetical protein
LRSCPRLRDSTEMCPPPPLAGLVGVIAHIRQLPTVRREWLQPYRPDPFMQCRVNAWALGDGDTTFDRPLIEPPSYYLHMLLLLLLRRYDMLIYCHYTQYVCARPNSTSHQRATNSTNSPWRVGKHSLIASPLGEHCEETPGAGSPGAAPGHSLAAALGPDQQCLRPRAGQGAPISFAHRA